MTRQHEPQVTGIPGGQLRAWREARGWDRAHLASQLRQHANGIPVADHGSLVRTIRRWEIGQNEVSERYGLLLRQLGYPEVTVDVSDVRWLAGRTRQLGIRSWVTIVSVALDIALSVVLIVFGFQLHAAAASQANLCQSGNASRAAQVRAWDYVLSLAGPPRTPAEGVRIDQFKARLAGLFAPRDCADIDPHHP